MSPGPGSRPARPRTPGWGALAAALPAAATLALALELERDPRPGIAERRSKVAGIVAQGSSEGHGSRTERLRLRAESGLEVELALKRPSGAAGSLEPGAAGDAARDEARLPLLVLIGGHDTGRRAIDLIADTRGVAIAALSYPFDGNPKAKGLALLGQIPKMRAAIRDTPPAILLALDWLFEQPWVDPARVELVGVSLGAPFVCIAGALDARVSRVWSIHGAGDPHRLLEFGLRRKIAFAPLRATCAELAWRLAGGSAIAPEGFVGAISPRPFVMLNASEDERLPRAAIATLFAGAGEPKELSWISGRHVSPRRTEIVRDLVDRVLVRVVGDR